MEIQEQQHKKSGTGEISRAQVHPELIFQVSQLQGKFGKAAKGVGIWDGSAALCQDTAAAPVSLCSKWLDKNSQEWGEKQILKAPGAAGDVRNP